VKKPFIANIIIMGVLRPWSPVWDLHRHEIRGWWW